MFYSRMVRPVLYRMGRGDPEAAHEKTLAMLTSVAAKPWMLDSLSKAYAVSAPTRVFGIDFPNPVGLAAGMDKNGVAVDAWPALGFGFVEIGTVTWRAQPGNPRPRLYRLPESHALINRMGFNNDGAQALARRLGSRPRPAVPVGISLGKSKTTPIEQAVDDYVASFSTLYPFGDYFAVNVSSPNTPGLRDLQDSEHLTELLTALREENEHQSRGGRLKPILVKIAPDLTESAIGQALEVCEATGVAGVIASNTTLGRDGVAQSDLDRSAQPGGLSGRPLRDITRSIVSFIHRETSGRLPVVGVGGVTTPEDAAALVDAGASLVQIYTGFVYSGPGLVRKSAKAIAQAGGGRRRVAAHGSPYQAEPGRAPYPTAEPPTGGLRPEQTGGFGSPYDDGHRAPAPYRSDGHDPGRGQASPYGEHGAHHAEPRSGAPSPYPSDPRSSYGTDRDPSPYPAQQSPSPYPSDPGPSPYGSQPDQGYSPSPYPAEGDRGTDRARETPYGRYDDRPPASPYESDPRSAAPSPYPGDERSSPYPTDQGASPYPAQQSPSPYPTDRDPSPYRADPPPYQSEPSPYPPPADDPYRHRGDDRRG